MAINQPGDQYEQEADRVAEEAVGGGRTGRPSISSLGSGGAVQREEPAKPKSEEEKYKEAAKKVGEAFLETPQGKEITKKAEELGDAFISTLPGKIITGAAVAGAVATLAATHKELPIGIPEIPLDKIRPGLKMKITYEGPVDKPTKVVATFSIPLGKEKTRDKKTTLSETEKFRAETARMAADQAKFREGLKSDEEKASEQEMINAYVSSRMLAPGQLTPRTSPLSFGAVGQDPGFRPGAPAAGPRRSLGPWAPDFKLSGETSEEPKKKEEGTLQRKAAGHQEVGSAPPIVDQVLQSSGEPLDRATREFMEDRFGYEFGSVRIHRDGRAAESARAVQARAYTVGQDVVFAGGSFAPETNAGRQLLAHELTHVLQQSALPPAVQRAVPAGLEVTGRKSGMGSSGAHSVFFERNDVAIGSEGKFAVLIAGGGAHSGDDLDLIGRVSEDEATTPAIGRTLADRRINAVDAELKTVGHTGKRKPDPKPDVGDGRLDYRSLREVEIGPAGATSAVPDCKKTAATGPCSANVETDFVAVRTEAQGLIDKARRLLTSGTDASTNDLRDEFFGGGGGAGSGAAMMTTLDANLGKVRAQMDIVAKKKRHRCGTLCNGTCTVAIAYNEDEGKKATLTLCPTFVSAGKQERKRNFIHETAHGTPGLGLAGKTAGTTDIAYRHERRIASLTPDQALQNSDSYSLFVMLAADPSFARPKLPVDKLTVAAGEKSGVADAITLLADWLKWSHQETASTYSTMVESRPPKKKWTNSYYEETMKLIAAQFGLTPPPALPTDDDRFAVAGLADRYKTLLNRVRADLNAKRDPAAKTTSWSAGPGTSIVLGDDFFALTTTPERTRLLLRALVGRVSNIIAGHQSKIVDLAEQLNARHPLP
ncbi:MAG: DUF4157 domain-containing protein [Chthoniobacterales bacterium]|nr:DUF4157 domain-containing protein [Chthoniobacterales bacterium]